jgi:hypothetical protein
MVDGVIRVDYPSLLQGFNVRKSYLDSMVGYYPRVATPRRTPSTGNTPDEYTYHLEPTNEFHLDQGLLPSRAFLGG